MMCPSDVDCGQKNARRSWGALRRLASLATMACLAAMAVPFAGCGGGARMSSDYRAKASTMFVRNGDFYVGGVQWDPSHGNPFAFPLAVLWRNGGVCRRIPERGHMDLNAPFVAGDGSSYAAGRVPRPGSAFPYDYARDIVAGYLKDGAIRYLVPADSDGPSETTSVFVGDGGDVYALGFSHGLTLWENGEPRHIPTGDGKYISILNALFVSGEDVYVAATEADNSENRCAALWKNGERLQLEGAGDGESEALSLFVHGGDVYVAGHVGRDAVVWKNGAAQRLAAGHGRSVAASVFVSGGDVYVSGSGDGVPLLWKNGRMSILILPPGGVRVARALGVFAHGGDVYVAGYTGNDPVVWKNGAAQRLPFAKE